MRPKRPATELALYAVSLTLTSLSIYNFTNVIPTINHSFSVQRSTSKKLYKKRSRLDLRKYAFNNRVVDHWNALSDACVTSNTIDQFKNCLKRELQPETHS